MNPQKQATKKTTPQMFTKMRRPHSAFAAVAAKVERAKDELLSEEAVLMRHNIADQVTARTSILSTRRTFTNSTHM
jgi:Flp pilus assembly protein TadD